MASGYPYDALGQMGMAGAIAMGVGVADPGYMRELQRLMQNQHAPHRTPDAQKVSEPEAKPQQPKSNPVLLLLEP